jgi:outer membrane protein TolC
VIVLPLILSFAAAPTNLDSLERSYLEIALRGNLSHAADSLDVASARSSEAGARSLLGPQGKVTGSLGGTSDLDKRTTESATATGTVSQWVPTGGTLAAALSGTLYRVDPNNPAPLPSGDKDTANLTLSFKQPFLQGFGDGSPVLYQTRMAKVASRTKFLAARGQGLSLLQQARVAFWNLIGAVATVQAQVQDSARTLRILTTSRIQFRSGSASALDTLTARANHGKALVALLQGRNSVLEGRRNLSALANVDSFEVPAIDSLPALGGEQAFGPVEGLVDSATRHATDLAQAQAKIEGLQAEVSYRRYSRLPKLDGTIYGASSLPGGNPAKDWMVGARVDLDWDLPNGVERAKYRSALLDLRSAEIRRKSAGIELRHQIQRIVDAYGSAVRQLALTVDLAFLQRARLAASEAGYGAGSVSLLDLQSTQTDWMNAVTASWQAKAQLKSLEAELETRTGIGPARLGWIWEE